ncbi:glycosyltransferase [Ruminococcaceae bacterium OttesenSCG-928-I18]|nr:glycosyltransferase [Ruminococcaceae bacterium OttesenSCG-928-I18]
MEARALSACVVQYGGAEETGRCLASLRAEEGDALQIYLVDNASPDRALEKLKAAGLPPEVKVLAQRENGGFGAGHNAVLPLLDSRYHAVINPDILLQGAAISQMAAWMDDHPDVALTIPKLVYPDGRPQWIAKRRPAVLPLLSRQLGWKALKPYEDHYLMRDEDLTKPIDVEFCSGSFFVIRTEVFREIGGFDEGYFMYVEDADITQKALQKGRAVYLPGVVVTHAWHRDAHRKPRQFFWQLKSMLRYFRKWGWRWK